MAIVTADQLRAHKTRDGLYILLHGKGAHGFNNQSRVSHYADAHFSLRRHKIS